MKLDEKGPIKPVPVLAGPGQITAEAIGSWPTIISATHWDLFNRSRVDGADFYVELAELGPIHLNGEVHLAATNVPGLPLGTSAEWYIIRRLDQKCTKSSRFEERLIRI